MQGFLAKGLTETATLWSDMQQGYGWVHRAAHLLTNDEKQAAAQVRRTYEDLLTELEQAPTSSETLTTMLSTFLKVTASYWPGLFHCYDLADLPRTNNELEQYFGSARYHERRATGRKQASPGLVVRGAVRVVASVASRLHPFSGGDLYPTDLTRWRSLRSELDPDSKSLARTCAHRSPDSSVPDQRRWQELPGPDAPGALPTSETPLSGCPTERARPEGRHPLSVSPVMASCTLLMRSTGTARLMSASECILEDAIRKAEASSSSNARLSCRLPSPPCRYRSTSPETGPSA